MLKVGRRDICEVYVGAVKHCQGYYKATQFFGCEEGPRVDSVVRNYPGGVYQFTLEDFTQNFKDVNGDSYKNVTISSLPEIGTIYNSGTPITPGFEFDLANVENLTYSFDEGYTVTEGGYCVGGECYPKSRIKFNFKTSDDSASLLYSNVVSFSFRPTLSGSLPVVSDNEGQLTSKEYTFSEASFTKDFSDPDGDSYKKVSIIRSPEIGQLELSGEPITEDQILLATDSSNLKFNLPDRYAIYEGVLYDFGRSIDDLISEQTSLKYQLTVNSAGELKFLNSYGEVNTISGTKIEDPITFSFITSDDSPIELYSEEATFSLIPTGNVNIKNTYANTPPTVGDNEFNI